MSAATIGSLKVVLGLDAADFEGGLTAAQKELRRAGREFQKVGKQIGDIGKTMSAAITLPVLGMGVAVTKTAADFESAMNRVSISTNATGDTFKQLSALAREIGRETVFSASTAADAIDMLAKSGVSVEDILGGAARAAVDLAAAAGSELDPAAAAITDSMAQFKLTVQDLPRIVNGITGAVNESKLDFSDFTMAIGQAGGVAANLGVTFEDFNTVLAATSPLFASGSDAGTSFKTFLQRMVPTTKKAAEAMAQYGLTFHDASGAMKPMADIAQMLQDKLGGLSDAAKSEVLSTIFGTDSMRTAIALMDQGANGLDNIAAKIAATDAAAQSAKRMEGLNGQLEQLGGAFEEVAIAIGESGLLETVTEVVRAVASVMEKVAALNPAILQAGLIFAGLAAAIGPVLMAVGALVSGWGALLTALGTGGVLAGLGAALASIAAVALPVVAVLGAIGLAIFAFRDELEPILRSFGEAVMAAIGPAIPPLVEALKSAFTSLGSVVSAAVTLLAPVVKFLAEAFIGAFGPIILTVLRTFVAALTGAFEIVGQTFRVLGALLRGDWSTAWNAAGSLVMSVVRAIGRIIEAVFPGITQNVARMVSGVAGWLQGKLFDVLKSVIDKVKGVSDAFFKLYDAVVGHSYVPDMVIEIGEWMAKLDEQMVRPAKKSTTAASQAFEDMRRRVQAIMRGLMTEKEKLDLAFKTDSLGIDQAEKNKLFPPEVIAEMRRRLAADFARNSAGLDAEGLNTPDGRRLSSVGDMPGVRAVTDAVASMNKAIHDSREKFADAFEYGINAAMRGDWQGVLRAIFGDILSNSFRSAGRSIFDSLGGGSPGGFNWSKIASGVGSLFSKIPGFSTGGSFKVGGSGGIDSKLVSMRLTPGEMVDVRRPGQDGGPQGGGNYFDLRGAVTTQDLINQMNAIGAKAEGNAKTWATKNVPAVTQSKTTKQQQHQIGRRKR